MFKSAKNADRDKSNTGVNEQKPLHVQKKDHH